MCTAVFNIEVNQLFTLAVVMSDCRRSYQV